MYADFKHILYVLWGSSCIVSITSISFWDLVLRNLNENLEKVWTWHSLKKKVTLIIIRWGFLSPYWIDVFQISLTLPSCALFETLGVKIAPTHFMDPGLFIAVTPMVLPGTNLCGKGLCLGHTCLSWLFISHPKAHAPYVTFYHHSSSTLVRGCVFETHVPPTFRQWSWTANYCLGSYVIKTDSLVW